MCKIYNKYIYKDNNLMESNGRRQNSNPWGKGENTG